MKSNVKVAEKDMFKYDIAVIDQDIFAGSSPYSRNIFIIAVKKGKIVLSLPTNHTPSAITFIHENIIFCVNKVGLMRLNIETGEEHKMLSDK